MLNTYTDYLRENLNRLTHQTRAYHDALYETNLPYWLLDRISSQVAYLKSQTCFWDGEGYFGGWEGCLSTRGSCKGNCTHVWQYAQTHARRLEQTSQGREAFRQLRPGVDRRP